MTNTAPLPPDQLEALVADLIEKTVGPCETAIADGGLKREQIDEVILVGGMTRMPRIQEKVAEIFAKPPKKGVNVDEAVAIDDRHDRAVLGPKVSRRLQPERDGEEGQAQHDSCQAGGNVHCAVGKLSFDETKLVENVEAVLNLIRSLKPSAAKGRYIKQITLTTTMT